MYTILQYLRFVFLLLVLMPGLFGVKPASAQLFRVSDVSSRFLSDEDYNNLIYSEAIQFATSRDISAVDFNARYPNYQYRFAEDLVPLLKSRFTVLDETYKNTKLTPGQAAFTRARASYLREAGDIVRTVFSGTHLFAGLFTPDNNDRFLSYHADINVEADGDILISEFITIANGDGTDMGVSGETSGILNDEIKRGIVRDFPTSYVDKNGFWSNTGFKVRAVYKDGQAEPYVTESMSNGTRIKIGSADVLLRPGTYQYRIDYETNRQLIFHKEKDELYWNVNGNGWGFTTDSVSCTIRFPRQAKIKEYACYTGFEGSTDRDCNGKVISNNSISFSSSKRLEAYQGLTVAVSIGKGILIEPGNFEKDVEFLKSNFIIPVLCFLLLFLICYYYFFWSKKGKDPEQGVTYPRFSPPPQLTPADCGFLLKQRFGPHLFAATLIDFAVKKQLVIEVEKKGIFSSLVYHFRGTDNDANVPDTKSEYGFNIQTLYGQTAEPGTYNSTLKGCYNALEDTLKKRLVIHGRTKNTLEGLFTLNKSYTRFGAFIVVLALLTSIVFLISHPTTTLLVLTLVMMTVLIAIHIFFVRIMSAYTGKGRKMADHVLGFRMYLEQAEQRVYEALTPPEKTLDLFEKYLPFAVALKVENSWADKFDTMMQKTIEQGYQPTYYYSRSNMGSFSMGSMSRNISSGMSGSISSASSPPSSSSGGSGGGGSSGGGGGGGGGGGW